ncbi:hypothetical protein GCM10027590_28090 [Nocardiopsis nanhaiensis]
MVANGPEFRIVGAVEVGLVLVHSVVYVAGQPGVEADWLVILRGRWGRAGELQSVQPLLDGTERKCLQGVMSFADTLLGGQCGMGLGREMGRTSTLGVLGGAGTDTDEPEASRETSGEVRRSRRHGSPRVRKENMRIRVRQQVKLALTVAWLSVLTD